MSLAPQPSVVSPCPILQKSPDVIHVSKRLLALLGSFLPPDVVVVYLTIKILGHERAPSKADVLKVLPTAKPILGRMRKDGFVTGKKYLDISPLDEAIKNASKGILPATKAVDPRMQQCSDQAHELTKALYENITKHGGKVEDRIWWIKQVAVARKALLKKQVPYDTLKDVIAWIWLEDWAKQFLAPHCDSMLKVIRYTTRFQMRKGRQAPASITQEHAALWASRR